MLQAIVTQDKWNKKSRPVTRAAYEDKIALKSRNTFVLSHDESKAVQLVALRKSLWLTACQRQPYNSTGKVEKYRWSK